MVVRPSHSLGEISTMRCIVYVSTALIFRPEAVTSLVGECAARNRRHRITGVLILARGNFLQVIEGEHEPVTALFRAIERDDRHVLVTPLADFSITARHFPDWSMTLKDIDELPGEIRQHCRDIFEAPPSSTPDRRATSVHWMLDAFRRHVIEA